MVALVTSNNFEAVQAYLSAAETHNLGQAPSCVRTHAAWVVLAGSTALKLKLPVHYHYLDFSTPQKRRAMLERELQVNQELGSTLYRDVVPVTREADGSLILGGKGQPVEWVLRMDRFNSDDLLASVADHEGINEPLAAQLGILVARQHRSLPPQPTAQAHVAVQSLLHDLVQSLQELAGTRSHGAAVIAGADAAQMVQHWATAAQQALQKNQHLLDERGRQGWVRRCHGDLHLGNLAMVAGEPQTFDALEFDESLATIDLFYDLAFLLMDLVFRGEPAAAGHVLSRYLLEWNQVEVEDGLATLPLFMSLRAAVRAMVTAQRSDLAGGDAELANEARAYLDAAVTYLDVTAPVLVGVGGLSGSGKSTLGRALMPHLGRPMALLLRSDLLRKRQWSCDEYERLPSSAYTPDASVQVYQQMREQAARALRAGLSVIADAVHLQPQERDDLAHVARQNQVPFIGVWLDAPLAELERRIADRRGDASDADVAVLARQAQQSPGEIRWRRLDATDPDRLLHVLAWVEQARASME